MPAQPSNHPAGTNESPVDLRSPGLAALLTWAIPGAGQIYQRRYFKGILFFVCILGMFFCGVRMGEGRPVYTVYYMFNEDVLQKKQNYGYFSQFLVGVVSLPAILQSRRFDSDANVWRPESPIDAPFEGALSGGRNLDQKQSVTGRISLEVKPSPLGARIEGRLVGTITETGEQIDLELAEYSGQQGFFPLGLKISANPKREVYLHVENVVQGPQSIGSLLTGSIPRAFGDWYQVPLQDDELQDLNARLGKRWELAMVLTWIAGLLNILAIWDAFEGPAYGIRPQTAKRKKSDSLDPVS